MEEKKYSTDFPRVKMRFDQGLWTKPMVKMAVRKGVIQKWEYKEITGELYE